MQRGAIDWVDVFKCDNEYSSCFIQMAKPLCLFLRLLQFHAPRIALFLNALSYHVIFQVVLVHTIVWGQNTIILK